MEFLDRTGHIFSINSYPSYPVGYEYQEGDYIFWFNSEVSGKLSVDNYYFKPIRIAYRVENHSSSNVNISLKDSEKFFLIGSKFINEKLLSSNIDKDINDRISIYENEIASSKELNYSFSFNYDNENVSLIEDGDLRSCIVEESSSIKYKHIYYTLTSGIRFEGSNIRLENGTWYGDVDIDGIVESVELVQKEEYLDYNEGDSLTSEELESLSTYKETYIIIPFYVIVKSTEAGVWETNVLINFDNLEYTPITVGAEIVDENEELIINGKNFGISLPKEIIRAIYSSDYSVSEADERLYALKLKEYLLNYMNIKGEVGNFKSAINALNWFEWGDKLTISKLYKTDNHIQNQYLIDYFDLINDNIYSYQLFKTTAYIIIKLALTEDGEMERQNLLNSFWGEGKPSIIHKFDWSKEVRYDEGDIPYYRGYFDYTFTELGLKLCALKYYYEKYFLPLHLRVHNLYMDEKVYANDIKLISKVSHTITENPIYINQFNYSDENITKELRVDFNKNGYGIIYLNRVKEFIDEEYNVFEDTYQKAIDDKIDALYIDDIAVKIPIDIYNYVYSSDGETYTDFNSNTYYDVHIYLSKYINSNISDTEVEINGKTYSNLKQIHYTHFSFLQNEGNRYKGLVIHPKTINNLEDMKFDINYWINSKFRIDAIINSQIFEFVFEVKLPELNIQTGKLKYKYGSYFRQIDKIDNGIIDFNAFMYQPDLVTINNIDFPEDIYFKQDIEEYVKKYYTSKINIVNDGFLNRCHLIDILDTDKNPIPYTTASNTQLFEELSLGSIDLYHDINSSVDTVNLYTDFFNDDGSYKLPEDLLYVNGVEYDFYLMHDYSRWYGVMISKDTINLHTKKDSKFSFYNKKTSYKFGNYILKYVRSDSKILINRYDYIPSYGVNHYLKDDIIVVSLYNNDKLQFKPSLGSKWTIKPLSIGMAEFDEVESNSELAVISIGDKNSKYERGYYSVSVQYSVDDYIQHIYTRTAKFRVDDEEELIEDYDYKKLLMSQYNDSKDNNSYDDEEEVDFNGNSYEENQNINNDPYNEEDYHNDKPFAWAVIDHTNYHNVTTTHLADYYEDFPSKKAAVPVVQGVEEHMVWPTGESSLFPIIVVNWNFEGIEELVFTYQGTEFYRTNPSSTITNEAGQTVQRRYYILSLPDFIQFSAYRETDEGNPLHFDGLEAEITNPFRVTMNRYHT